MADENTKVIIATGWSKPVSLQNLETGHDHANRGRLLIIAGSEPAYGGPLTINHAMTFVELQNVTGCYSETIDVCFDVMKLNCTLTNANGKSTAKPEGSNWGGRGPLGPTWVTLPYNSTIRLFVNCGSKTPLNVYPNGEPWTWWSISPSDTNVYYLTGTLEIFTRTNGLDTRFPEPFEGLRQTTYDRNCKAALIFPKVKIPAKK